MCERPDMTITWHTHKLGPRSYSAKVQRFNGNHVVVTVLVRRDDFTNRAAATKWAMQTAGSFRNECNQGTAA